MPYFSANSLKFHYLDAGEGLPFVCQHGLGGDTRQIQDVFEPPPGFRLLAFDCRGHGETRPAGDPDRLSFEQYSADLLAFLDILKLERVALGGISMGAGVALNFALRYPQRVRALVLARPAWLHEPLPGNLQIYPRAAALIRQFGAVRGGEMFQSTDEYQRLLSAFPAAAASVLKQFARPRAEECVDILERLPGDTPSRSPQAWARIQVPTLVLAHAQDPIHPLRYGEILAQSIPGALLQQVTPKETDSRQHASDIRLASAGFLAALT